MNVLSNDSTPSSGARGRHALVVGGSIAGLLAARVLQGHFERVTVVERDTLPDAPVGRHGAPQANHNHVLLLRGRDIMERLFPGLRNAVVGRGGVLIDMADELAWLTPWGWGARLSSPLVMLACSRTLLEWQIRCLLAESPAITFLTGVAVSGLLATGGRVRGVRTGAGDVEAGLVVDASGRGSRAGAWLQGIGFEAPGETVVDAFLGYASRIYRPRPDSNRWWKGMYIQAAPPDHSRVGVILPIESGLWHVTIGGGDRQHPPDDERGFLEFARTLRSPAIYEAIAEAEPCSPIYRTRSTQNRRREFHESALPEGFVVTGDAACAFNPVYGQGMTTAAIAAELLDACLRQTRWRTGSPEGNGLARRFQRALARANALPWSLAIGEDLRYRSTAGAKPTLATRGMHRYMDAVGRLTVTDPDVRLRLLRAFHMVAPPRSLFAPAVLWKLLRDPTRGDAPADAPRGRTLRSSSSRVPQEPPIEHDGAREGAGVL